MQSPAKALVAGSVTSVIGLLLWLFTGDVDTPVVDLDKVGLVLLVVGVAEMLYGGYLVARSTSGSGRGLGR